VEKSVIPLYQNFIENTDLYILVYSGDVDAIVPVTGTRAWLAQLNRYSKPLLFVVLLNCFFWQ
jgi:hypothetical protein